MPPPRLLTHDEALALLRERVAEAGGIRRFYHQAAQQGRIRLGKGTVEASLRGDRLITPGVAVALGLRRRVTYEVVE